MALRRRLVFVLALAVASSAGAVELVRAGRPVARIVVATDAPAAERFAASEFQAHLAAMTGARLPIDTKVQPGAAALVLVGEGAARLAGPDIAAAAQLGEVRNDGYAVTTLDDHKPPCLVLAARQPRGTLYAVYNLLETFGCGFFSDGDNVPRRRDVAVAGLTVIGNPAFPARPCWVPTRFYGPKSFYATLWNADDWKRFLRWMAKKKLNCLAIEFGGATRAWGEAFERAFPETKPHKRESLDPADQPPTPGPTARMGWGLHPSHTTALWKEVFAYARETLGLEVCYVLHVGEFELPLRLAHPKLRWLAATPEDFVGVAGQSVALAPSEPQCRELQARLWRAILDTYGTDHRYVVRCHRHKASADARRATNPVVMAYEILRSIDPKAQILVSSDDHALWGSTQEEKTEFLRRLPDDVSILYAQVGFPGDELYRATERFAGRPFHYAGLWALPGADLFEYCFDQMRTIWFHTDQTPRPNATGYWNWAELRGTNPLMDQLSAEQAWTGRNTWRSEGASNNPETRLYLTRRLSPTEWWRMAEIWKLALRGAPRRRTEFNYRDYLRWVGELPAGAESIRAAIVVALGGDTERGTSPLWAAGDVQLGRMYLHQYLAERASGIMTLVQECKGAARQKAYSPQQKARALARLKELENGMRLGHQALTRLIAGRKDMCLDDAILEATRTRGANRNLALAIREHQSGLFAGGRCVVDSIEYHQQVRGPQIEAFLAYAREQVTAPTPKPIPAREEFVLRAAQAFVGESKPAPFETKAEKARPAEILKQFIEKAD